MSRRVSFLKGHGTGNDFIVLPDPDGVLDLQESDVRWLCDRHRGLGADGVIRIAPARLAPDRLAPAHPAPVLSPGKGGHGEGERAGDGEWFMDYRNADGSLAEMCGNGARVFLRALQATGLLGESDGCVFQTRGGLRRADLRADGRIAIEMGRVDESTSSTVQVTTEAGSWPARTLHVPNPHAVVILDGIEGVDPGPTVHSIGMLAMPPEVAPRMPDGVNVEFVQRLPDGSVRMRVHERGVGETQACGTGACAVAWSIHSRGGTADAGRGSRPHGLAFTIRIHQPGGVVDVECSDDGLLTLVGEAQIVAEGTAVLP